MRRSNAMPLAARTTSATLSLDTGSNLRYFMRSMKTSSIQIRKIRQNNLKDFDLDIPLGALTVITGVSGSGKSSLAFDTLYAEGSRRYIESLSTYARQFLEQMPRPDVEVIHNLPPAIALEQRNSITSSRTTVATMTELYDYIRLLFSSIGDQQCKACGNPDVALNDAESISQQVLQIEEKTKLYVLAPVAIDKENPELLGQELFKQGFQRLLIDNEVVDLASVEGQTFIGVDQSVHILIDRIVINKSLKEDMNRLVNSVEQALQFGGGEVVFQTPEGKRAFIGRQGYACTRCGEQHTPPTPALFSFNSPLGACKGCNGFGEILALDEELIVPDPEKTLRSGAIDPLSKPSYKDWEEQMLRAADKAGINTGKKYVDLSDEEKEFLWKGNKKFPGIEGYFDLLKQWKYKLHVRVFVRRYQMQRKCHDCKGAGLAPDPLRFTIGEGQQKKTVADVLKMNVAESREYFKAIKLPDIKQKKSGEILRQIVDRLDFLFEVGVHYITLNRKGNTLSGGEFQRISLATQLGAKLSSTLYVLDEPSIGLHPVDTSNLIGVLKRLQSHGNTVVVVEHETAVMKAADFLVELGPNAGRTGGSLIAHGARDIFLKDRSSLTSRYLSGELALKTPKQRRKIDKKNLVQMRGCTQNNLQNVDVDIPLGVIVAVTGVSGSGKSTLIHDTFYKAAARFVMNEAIPSFEMGKFDKILGLDKIDQIILLDQKPIGRSSRSNPATYLKIYDDIRRILANQPNSVRRNLTPKDFSFNVDGGRCPGCKGEGSIEVDMHFMANIQLVCPDCDGKRFKKHVLDVTFKDRNVDDILHLTIEEAKDVFIEHKVIVEKLELLESVGLGYLQLGQSVATLSGGECQRLKIASTLDQQRAQRAYDQQVYIFDEPTTGLHLHDIKKLAGVMHSLVEKGHTVIFIEHNLELIAQADHVIDIGPGGGTDGGAIVAQGTPEQIAKSKKSLTGKFLKDLLG